MSLHTEQNETDGLQWLSDLAAAASADAAKPELLPSEDVRLTLVGYEQFSSFLRENATCTFSVLAHANESIRMNEAEFETYVRDMVAKLGNERDLTNCRLEYTITPNHHFFFQIVEDKSVLAFQRVAYEEDPQLREKLTREKNEAVILDTINRLNQQLTAYGTLYVPTSDSVVRESQEITKLVRDFTLSSENGDELFTTQVICTEKPLSLHPVRDTDTALYSAVTLTMSPTSESIETRSLQFIPDAREVDEISREYIFSGTQARKMLQLIKLWPDEIVDAFPEKLLLRKIRNGFVDFPWEVVDNIYFIRFDDSQKRLSLVGLNRNPDEDGVTTYEGVGSSLEDHPEGKWINTLCTLVRNYEAIASLLDDGTVEKAIARAEQLRSPAYRQTDLHLFTVPESLGVPKTPDQLEPALVNAMERRYSLRLNRILEEILDDGKGDILGAIVDSYSATVREFTKLSLQGLPLDAQSAIDDSEVVTLEGPKKKMYSVLGILDDPTKQAEANIQNGHSLERTWAETETQVKHALQKRMQQDLQAQFAGEAASLLNIVSDDTRAKLRAELMRHIPTKKVTTYKVNGVPVSEEQYTRTTDSFWVQFRMRDPDKKEVEHSEVPLIVPDMSEVYRLCIDFLDIDPHVRISDKDIVEAKLKSYDTAFQVTAKLEAQASMKRQFDTFASLMPDLTEYHHVDEFPSQFVRQGGMGGERVVIELQKATEEELNTLANYLETGHKNDSEQAFLKSELFREIKNADPEAIRALYAKVTESSEQTDISLEAFIDFIKQQPDKLDELAILLKESNAEKNKVVKDIIRDALESRRRAIKTEFTNFCRLRAQKKLESVRSQIDPFANALQSYLESIGMSSEEATKVVADRSSLSRLVITAVQECLTDFATITELHKSIMARLKTLNVHVAIPYAVPRQKPTPKQMSEQEKRTYDTLHAYLMK